MYDIIVSKKKAIYNFKKGGQDIKFEEVATLGKSFIEIEVGVLVRTIKRVNPKFFILECKMTDKAELDLHKHSDYIEAFYIKEGALFDKHTNTYINRSINIGKDTWHNLVSIGASRMYIYCIK